MAARRTEGIPGTRPTTGSPRLISPMPRSLRSNAEWQWLGEHDPLWSVATWHGKEAGNATAWTAEAFLALGASDFADVRRHWDHYGRRQGRCVEIGCGAGRMTSQLCRTFSSVLALDVSE